MLGLGIEIENIHTFLCPLLLFQEEKRARRSLWSCWVRKNFSCCNCWYWGSREDDTGKTSLQWWLRIEKVLRAIGELIHLRYLDLYKKPLTTLPSTIGIGKLQNLQTLKLVRCYKFEKLPVEITKFVNLRHHMPLGIGKLTSLRTLPRFVLGKSPPISKCGAFGWTEEP